MAKKDKQTISSEIMDLARETVKWAMKNGCVRDPKTGEIGNYFIIEVGKNPSGKPIWTEEFEEDRETFGYVKLAILALGFAICYDQRQGHYIGAKGETGKNLGSRINGAATSFNTIKEQFETIILAGMYAWTLPFLLESLKSDLKDNAPNLLGAIDRVLELLGQPVQMSLVQALLEAQKPDDEDGDEE